ncbi:hypothetical protein HOLleu_36236 [Holothuria leucospilota]|uniref:Integrase catalytic domain-containing protein n=1 Tax=Holothuria leucospilota TaxID=206669 RepID=A0A9Q1BFJ6_HOLLE|nr:hypothetical protein HOLleu_36236 [Holothuria leucospilota]
MAFLAHAELETGVAALKFRRCNEKSRAAARACLGKQPALQTHFTEVVELKENTYSQTIIELAKLFSVHGKPEKFISDNGTQFRSHAFFQFSREWHLNISRQVPAIIKPMEKWKDATR